MDGLLLIDKPAGPTSHDVVERMRRVLHQPRIGHTGTLDPAATGLLPLVLGRATRLARFLSASDKTYEAAIRLGVTTATADAGGEPVGPPYVGPMPTRDAIDRALDAFRGTHPQRPPAFSAKRIAGQRSYKLARRARSHPDWSAVAVQAAAVNVTAHAIDLLEYESQTLTLRLDVSAGFYVRSLAHDLGQDLGIGAHLMTLRRTRAGAFTVDEAIPLAAAEQQPERAVAAIVPMAGMLANWSSVVLSAEGVRRALNGRDLGPGDIQATPAGGNLVCSLSGHVRLVDHAGELIGIGEPANTPGLLHPSVVLR
jgi:tRNA pseudouridine55 synthase